MTRGTGARVAPQSDTTDELRARISELEARLGQMEAKSTRSPSMLLDRVVPQEARGHFRRGSREQLLGLRSLLDHWIGRLGQGGEQPQAAATRRNIPIE